MYILPGGTQGPKRGSEEDDPSPSAEPNPPRKFRRWCAPKRSAIGTTVSQKVPAGVLAGYEIRICETGTKKHMMDK